MSCALVLDEAYNEYVEEPDSQGGLELFRANANVIVLSVPFPRSMVCVDSGSVTGCVRRR